MILCKPNTSIAGIDIADVKYLAAEFPHWRDHISLTANESV